jgi:hypothetical protein
VQGWCAGEQQQGERRDNNRFSRGNPMLKRKTALVIAPQPTKEFVKVEQVAALAGAMLSIDGGWTAQ